MRMRKAILIVSSSGRRNNQQHAGQQTQHQSQYQAAGAVSHASLAQRSAQDRQAYFRLDSMSIIVVPRRPAAS